MASTEERASLLSTKIVLWQESEDILDYFELGRELGRGHFGVVHVCVENSTGKQFACKCVSKVKLKTTDDIELIRREVMVMHTLLGVENTVQIKATFENAWFVFIVMELCTGGELFDRITQTVVCPEKFQAEDRERLQGGTVALPSCAIREPAGVYRETSAARLFREILTVIAACHSMGICHRDVKPENFLLTDTSETATLKAADFGLSVFFQEGQVFDEFVGTIDYLAPEILRRRYGQEVDMWAAGVILFVLLSGQPPFPGETDQAIFQSIQRCKVRFDESPWDLVSSGAKDLIQKCLCKDPQRRITAEQALQHEWVREGGGAARDVDIRPHVLDRLRSYAGLQKLKKLGLQLLVRHLRNEEIEGLRRIFLDIDSDGSETITVDELVQGLERHGSHLARAEVEKLVESMDLPGHGKLNYDAFLAATVHHSKATAEENLFFSFAEMDADGDGFVTADELAAKLLEVGATDVPLAEIRHLIAEADTNGDGRVDYCEFMAMMAPGVASGLSSEAVARDYKERIAKSRSALTLGGSSAGGSGGRSGGQPSPSGAGRRLAMEQGEPLSKLKSLLGRSAASSWAAPASAPEAEWGARSGGTGTDGAGSGGAPSESDGGGASTMNTCGSWAVLADVQQPGGGGASSASGSRGGGASGEESPSAGSSFAFQGGFPRSHLSGLPRPGAGGSVRRDSGWLGVVVRPSNNTGEGAPVVESRQCAAKVIAEAGGLDALSRRWRAWEWPKGAVFGEGDRGDSGGGGGDQEAPARRDDGDGSSDEEGSRRGRVILRRRRSSEEFSD